MRVITAMDFAEEAGIQCYAPNALTRVMIKPPIEAAVKIWYGRDQVKNNRGDFMD